MEIKFREYSFPYPFLREHNINSYVNGSFKVDVKVEDHQNDFIFDFTVLLDSDYLLDKIMSEQAEIYVVFETEMYRKAFNIAESKRIAISKKLLPTYCDLVVQPLVIATTEFEYQYHNDHDVFYKDVSFLFTKGTVLASSQVIKFNVDDRMTKREIMHLVVKDKSENQLTTSYDFSSNEIEIKLPADLFKSYEKAIETLGEGEKSSIVSLPFASVAIERAIWEICESYDNHKGKLWAKIVSSFMEDVVTQEEMFKPEIIKVKIDEIKAHIMGELVSSIYKGVSANE